MERERLIGKLEERVEWIASRVEKMEAKIDQLLSFKWQIIGGSLALSFLATMLVELFRR